MLILILFGIYVMHISWGNSIIGLAVMMIAFGLAAVSMGATLGTFTKTAKQANSLSIMLGMGMGFLGGCGWPIELFPPAMQKVAMVLPTYWAMQGFTDLAMRGEGLNAIWLEAGVLVLFAVVFFIIGVGRFRYE
jgi:ABC-2 type transport system permease protein